MIFINEIVCRLGLSLSIISDRSAQLKSRFWRSFPKGLGTKVMLSTSFNPQTNGQAERTIQTFANMLSEYIIDCNGNWDKHFPLVEFSYNNI